jgi:hypothetical protein
MLQDRASLRLFLDAQVSIALGTTGARASHDQTPNKLLYAALVSLADPGKHQFTVTVSRQGARATISGELNVAPPAYPIANYWAYLAVPPLSIAIFLTHQRLIGQRSRRTAKPCEIT